MAMERTISIIKPDAVARGVDGQIVARIQREGFTVRAMRRMRLSQNWKP